MSLLVSLSVAVLLLLHVRVAQGMGILMYVELIQSLVATGHPVVVLEHPHVSLRLCTGTIPTTDDVAEW